MSTLTTALTVPDHLNPASVAIRMAGTTDNPTFCLADVCRVLGIGNPSDVVRRLDEDEKMTLDSIEGHSGQRGGAQFHTYITESGLYTVLLTSRVENAKPFRKWVTGEVLPSIRKFGCYPAPAGGQPQPQTLPPWSQRLTASFEAHARYINHHCPDSWSVLTAISTQMMVMEDVLVNHLIPLSRKDLPDGSIGSRWATHRKGLGLPEPTRFAPLCIPELRKTVDVKLYGAEEWGHFSRWLHQQYMPAYLPEYFSGKWKRRVGVLPPMSAANGVCRRICNREAILPLAVRLAIDEAPEGIIRATPCLTDNKARIGN